MPREVRDVRREGGFLANQRNAVLIGGTGTGKSHLAVAIARACIRDGARGRFFNVVDLIIRLEGRSQFRAFRWLASPISWPGAFSSCSTSIGYLHRLARNAKGQTAVPPRQLALRAHLNHGHHQPELRQI